MGGEVKVEASLVGPRVTIVSFICSVGNVPLAAVLWQGGISILILAILLLWRVLRSRGPAMLRAMNRQAGDAAHMDPRRRRWGDV